MKPYLHTLVASISHRPVPLSTIRYRPAIDRLRGTQLEVQLSIPANTSLSLTWEFDKSILRYTEYPPDANRGFDVAYSSPLFIVDVQTRGNHDFGRWRVTYSILTFKSPNSRF